MNPNFARTLRKKLRHWSTREASATLELFEGNVLSYSPVAPMTGYSGGLPLNNSRSMGVEAFSRKVRQLLKPKGYFVFFEYRKNTKLRTTLGRFFF